MNLKSIIAGLSLCSLLLVILSILSVSNDQSTFLAEEQSESIPTFGILKFIQGGASSTTATKQYDLGWLGVQIEETIDDIIDPSYARLDAHIFTDKVIYRPKDVVFIEVLVLNTFNKTPIAMDPLDQYNYQYYLTFEVKDPSGSLIYTDYNYVQDGTGTFTYKVPADAVGGEYEIKFYNSYMQPVKKLIRIRDYPRDQLVVKAVLNQESYRPGDTVSGQLTVAQPDGEAFEEDVYYQYSVNFNQSQLTVLNQSMGTSGQGFFSFKIPSNTTIILTTIGFTVSYAGINQTYGASLVISSPGSMIIDFYTENGLFVSNVTNKIYFQAWATKERADSFDFSNASLKLKDPSKKSPDITIVDRNISTMHKGKGSFMYKHQSNWNLTLEIYIGTSNITKEVRLRYNNSFFQVPELTYSVLNKNRVLNNNDSLDVYFETNSLMNSSDIYVLQIKLKEQILYQEQYQFNKSSNWTTSIKPNNFSTINGGIFSVSLYKLTKDFIVYYDQSYQTSNKSIVAPNNTQVINWLQPKGEIIFFIKPNDTIGVIVKTNNVTYAPGDTVTYEVNVFDKKTKKLITDRDVLISLVVTDDSVFQKVEDRKQPPSLAASVYLENEVMRDDFEFYHANEYINHWFLNSSSTQTSNNRNLELLLGVQGWRMGCFDLGRIEQINNNITNMTEDDQVAYQQLIGYPLVQPVYIYYKDGMVADNMAPAVPAAAAAGTAGAINKNANAGVVINGVAGIQVQTETVDDVEDNENTTDYMTGITMNTRYWAHPVRKSFSTLSRVDFTETLLFSSASKTKSGILKGTFKISDLITKFRVSVNAIDAFGKIGFNSSSFQTQKSLYITFDVPSTFALTDVIKVDVKIANLNSFTMMAVKIFQLKSSNATKFSLPTGSFILLSRSTIVKSIYVSALNVSALDFISLGVSGTYNGATYSDGLSLPIRIVPKGFAREFSTGGQIGSRIKTSDVPSYAEFMVDIPQTLESGSQEFIAKIYSSNFASLLEAVEALIQDPNGCFEQTSSTTYPMVMALQFINALPTQNDQTKEMKISITSKLQKGYDKLVSFKTKEKGYEWFGESPAHEALSSYGLMQFTEMSKVTSFVDSTMVSDLKNWIMSRKNGKGSFKKSEQALDSFGRAPDNITDAYIIWTLTSSGETNVTTEITALKTLADASIKDGTSDAYFLGLLSASLYNLNRTTEAQTYADQIRKSQLSTGNVTRSATTITNSDGENKVIETTAMSVVAWMFNQNRYATNITNAVNWLVSRVKSGSYGSTQGTILSLKALTTYMKNFASINGNGTFVLRINSLMAQSISFTSAKKDAIAFDFTSIMKNSQFKPFFNAGKSLNISIALEDFTLNSDQTKDFLVNYAFSFNYYDTTPQTTSSNLDFQILQNFNTSALGQDKMLGKVFTYNITLTNLLEEKGMGMTVAIVRIPTCLQIQYDFLEALKRNKIVDFYEVRNQNTEMVFYWRQMAPGEVKSFSVDLMQRYSGVCVQKPHTAYPYYNDDQPVWAVAQKA